MVVILTVIIDFHHHPHLNFSEILAPATCIVVSVTASTTQGKALEQEELAAVQEACDMAEKLHTDRLNMYQLVESRMSLIAPNLCEILGAGTAAMIVAKAGGIPFFSFLSCNRSRISSAELDICRRWI